MKPYQFYLFVVLIVLASLSCINTNETQTITTEKESVFHESEISDDTTSINPADSISDQAEFLFTEEGYQTISMRAFIADPDEENPTNVRDKPNGKVIAKLPPSEDYMFRIVGQKEGWFQFKDLKSFSDETSSLDGLSGWLHHSVVGASSRNCEQDGIFVYRYPEEKKEFQINKMEYERFIRFDQLYFDFVHVIGTGEGSKKIEGWLKVDCTCGNPVTTCP